jgi:nitrite reductase/ring-hydroxylating ferredoxin subunit
MSENWIAAGAADTLDSGCMRAIEHGDLFIALYNVDGTFYATDNVCSHAYALLTDGFLDGDIIECPLHQGCFKVSTGEGQGAPISENIRTFPTRVVGAQVEIDIA